jgi:hypothetical protein
MNIIRSKTVLYILILLSTGLLLFSCKDKITDPALINNKEFRFIINVKDIKGNPVKGLRVSAWGTLSIENQLGFNKMHVANQLNKAENILASSFLGFSIARQALVTLSVVNLRNQSADTLVERNSLPGQYQVAWTIPQGTPSGVYKIRLSALADSIHFQDSIYAVYHNIDPEQNIIGWTGTEGIFEMTDSHRFPKNLDLPAFCWTNSAGPDSIGTFNYTDSVAVCLTDTITHEQELYYLTVGKQKNTFDLTWNPAPVTPPIPIFSMTEKSSILSDTITVIPVTTLTTWKLFQNYPNPFN